MFKVSVTKQRGGYNEQAPTPSMILDLKFCVLGTYKETIMLNLIKSFIITFVSVIFNIVSFMKGPLLVGLIVGASILAFAGETNAAEVYAPYQCNVSACPIWDSLSYSQSFGLVVIALALVATVVLLLKDSK